MKKLLLPIAAVSLFALAACDNRTEAPDQPDPDAGNPEAVQTVPEDDTAADVDVASPEEMQQRREEIEQEANESFESIMEETDQAGDTLVEMGNDAMSALSDQMTNASDAISVQIDALVENAAQVRDDNMTDEQKLEVVMNVRNAAEEAARALGQSEVEITQAGDTAEDRARQAMGL